jgi:cobalt-precorrin 5A hydrolase/precorrin-3B C17-methyltransferase
MMTTMPAGMLSGARLPGEARLVAGIGCSSAADAAEIVALVEQGLAALGAPAAALIALASHVRKAGSPALLATARYFEVPLRLLDDAELAEASPSAVVLAAIGRPAIAEAVAAAAGPLLLAKRKSARATCAIALCAPGFDALRFGQPSSWSAAMAASMLSTSSAGP